MRREFLCAFLVLSACAADEAGKGPEAGTELLGDDGKADSHQNPTDHGQLSFGVAQKASLAASAGFHAWQFEVYGDAHIVASTGPQKPKGKELDTVLYLYRQGPNGWGSYIARN